MATFRSPHNNRTVDIRKHGDGNGVTLKVNAGLDCAAIYLNSTDAPALALIVLQAAGYRESTQPNDAIESAVTHLAGHVRDEGSKARQEAAEAARAQRRTELTREFLPGVFGNITSEAFGRAIERIIEMEEAQK